MRIAVVGAGGVGGYFATRWAEAGRDVILLARGSHLDAIQKRGLRLRSPLGDVHVEIEATGTPSALSDADLVIFSTKTWQLPQAFDQVRPYLREEVVVLGVQNGVESAELLSSGHSHSSVLGGSCRVISYVEEPATIRHIGLSPTITLGEPAGGYSDRAARIARLLAVSGYVTVEASVDITADIWRKFLVFSAVSGVGSFADATIGSVLAEPKTRSLVASAIAEAANIGRALDVQLKKGAEERALSFLDTVPADGTSSMHRDFAASLRTELEATSGYLCRVGRDLGIPTPTHDLIYESLIPLERAARDRSRGGD
ncbi:ketopantoate reductase family protein [Gemmatimonadales bacterium]|nr:ketopantoate reductase family protein [Gemmatimonadales bacterium]